MRNNKTDQFYIDAYDTFITKMECAMNQIKTRNMIISTNLDYSVFNIADHSALANANARPRGQIHLKNCWYIHGEVERQRVRPGTYNHIHPFPIILEGRYSRSHDAGCDIEVMFGFIRDTVSIFTQGFANQPHYEDCWDGYHWSSRASFHIGRFLLHKWCGPKLKYEIPIQLKDLCKL